MLWGQIDQKYSGSLHTGTLCHGIAGKEEGKKEVEGRMKVKITERVATVAGRVC